MEGFRLNEILIHSDLLSYILSFIPFNYLIKIKSTCKLFNKLLETSLFWKTKAKLDFNYTEDNWYNINRKYNECKYLQVKIDYYKRRIALLENSISDNPEVIQFKEDYNRRIINLTEYSQLMYFTNDLINIKIVNIKEKLESLLKYVEKIDTPKLRYKIEIRAKTFIKEISEMDYNQFKNDISTWKIKDFKCALRCYFLVSGIIGSFQLFILSYKNEYIYIYTYRASIGLKFSVSITPNILPELLYQVAVRHKMTKRMLKEVYEIPCDFQMRYPSVEYSKDAGY